MRFRSPAPTASAARLQMSAMIDIVFLLLVFFVMTFRIVPQEGDFAIQAALPTSHGTSTATTLPMFVHLSAGMHGSLAGVKLNGRAVASLAALQQTLIELDAEQALAESRLTLQCDSSLKYDHVIAALDAVTGYEDSGHRFHPLISSVAIAGSD